MAIEEPELVVARRAFTASQPALAGPPLRYATEVAEVGWHGTAIDPERGAFALVRRGLEDLVGEILSVAFERRVVYVYVLAARNVPSDLSLTRAAFLRVSPLWRDILAAEVGVVG